MNIGELSKFRAGIATDTISENTAASGVSVDSVLLKDGGVDISVTGTAAGQVKFPATQNASADGNTLDDYEENTWTPTIRFGTNGNLASTGTGVYTKIGRSVTVQCQIAADRGAGTPAGQLLIEGLPFAANATYGVSLAYVDRIGAATYQITAALTASQIGLYKCAQGTGAFASVAYTDVVASGTTFTIICSATYFV